MRARKFYVTRTSLIASFSILFFAIIVSSIYIGVFKSDPYTKKFRSLKTELFESIGIEFRADHNTNKALFTQFALDDVSVKFKGDKRPFFYADTLVFDQSFISLILVFTKMPIPLRLTIENGRLNIDNTKLATEAAVQEPTPPSEPAVASTEESGSSGFDPLQIIKHGLSVNIDSFSVSIKDVGSEIKADKFDANISFDGGLNINYFNLNLPSFHYIVEDGIKVNLENVTASSNEDGVVNFNFGKTLVHEPSTNLTIDIDNLSPYFAKDYNRHQALHVPFPNMEIVTDALNVSFPEAEFIMEFIDWKNINFIAKMKEARFGAKALGSSPLVFEEFEGIITTNKRKDVLQIKSKLSADALFILNSFTSELNVSIANFSPSIEGWVELSNIVFDGVQDSFVLGLDLNSQSINLSMNSISESAKNNGDKQLHLAANLDLVNSLFRADMVFDGFEGAKTRMFLPPIVNLLLNDSSFLNGTVTLSGTTGGEDLLADGSINLSLSNIHLFSNKGDLTTVGTISVKDNIISIPKVDLRVFDYLISLNGAYPLSTMLPEVGIVIYKDNEEVAHGNFLLQDDIYRGQFASEDEGIYFSGAFDLEDETRTTATGRLGLYSSQYPFEMSFDHVTKYINLSSTGINLSGILSNNGRINIDANNFKIPQIPIIRISEGVLNSVMVLQILDKGWQITSNNVNVKFDTGNSLEFRMLAGTRGVLVQDLKLMLANNLFDGNFFLDPGDDFSWDPFKLSVGGALVSQTSPACVYVSYLPNGEAVSLFLRLEGFDGLSAIKGNPFDKINLSIIAETNLKDKHSAHGSLNATSKTANGDRALFNIGFNNNILTLSDVDINYGSLSLTSPTIFFNLNDGRADMSLALKYMHPKAGGAKEFSFNMNATGDLKAFVDNGFSTENLREGINVDFRLSNINIANTFFPNSFGSRISLTGDRVVLSGTMMNGFYDFNTSDFGLYLDDSFGLGMDLSGYVRDGMMDIKINDISLAYNLLDSLIWTAAVYFGEGVFEGDLRLIGKVSNPQFFGSLYSDKAGMRFLWAEKEDCLIIDPVLNFFGNTANIPRTEVLSTHLDTGRLSSFEAWAEFTIRDWNLPHLKLAMDVDENNPVSVSVPIPGPNMNLDVEEVWGHLEFDLYDLVIPDMRFNLVARNGTIAPPARLPSWFFGEEEVASNTSTSTSDATEVLVSEETGGGVDYTKVHGTVKIINGGHFMYPSINSPIINANLAENQEAVVTYENGRFYADGDLEINSGEIFYFQKNFLITEGSISWHKTGLIDAIVNPSDLEGLSVSLTARLKDFDLKGEPTDIYLSVSNATLDNITPRLSSSTGLSDAEILSILGENILPTSTYTSAGISSLAYMSSVALDIFGRLGTLPNLGENTFSETVERALGLDLFSIRQRIFYNVLADIIPDSSGKSTSESAFSRYLNGTTIFMGKHIAHNIFFQATIHFLSSDKETKKGSSNSFFIQGLQGDLELAFEWNNELASFSLFTNPNELSFLGIMDNIGISITKHFVI